MLHRWTKSLVAVTAIAFTAACAQQSEVGTTIEPGEAGQEAVEDTADLNQPTDALEEDRRTTWQAMATKVGETDVKAEIAIRDEEPGGTFASIALDGEASHTYPWHVHEGHCGSGGSIVGDAAAYGAVTTDAEGEGQATADLAVNLDPDANYYVNVHASTDDLATIVACGEVETQ